MVTVEEKIYNIDLLCDELHLHPHTYETILEDKCNNTTSEFVLRRKLNNLCKAGTVSKANIPGTRYGKAIFFMNPKVYYILVEATRAGSIVYYFEKYKKLSNFQIELNEYFELAGCEWKKKHNKIVNTGSVLLFI